MIKPYTFIFVDTGNNFSYNIKRLIIKRLTKIAAYFKELKNAD